MKVFGVKVTATAIIGILIVVAVAASAVFAPWIAPHDPNALMGGRWEPPSEKHWLGLDQIGRDMFSRILYGGRISIGLSLVATVLAFVVGIMTGFAAALQGGWVDALLSRIADVILSIPTLISALIVLCGFGTGTTVLVLTIGLLYSVLVFRAVRAAATRIAGLGYVEAARLRGEGAMWITLHEVLPNAGAPLAAEFCLRFSFAFLFIAALGFLGLGVQPPDADWGSMVRESALAVPAGIAAPLYPAAAIALMALGVNMVADWLLSIQPRPRGEEVRAE